MVIVNALIKTTRFRLIFKLRTKGQKCMTLRVGSFTIVFRGLLIRKPISSRLSRQPQYVSSPRQFNFKNTYLCTIFAGLIVSIRTVRTIRGECATDSAISSHAEGLAVRIGDL
jgi:hypothetical protein